MGSIRFTSILYALILIISLHSFAYCHQAMEIKRMVAAANEFSVVDQGSTSTLGKGQPFDAVPAAPEATKKDFGSGRKMMMKRRIVLMKKQMVKLEEGVNEDQSSKISGAKPCNHKAGNVKREKTNSNLISSRRSRANGREHDHMKVRMSTFVALNADYHVPKPHPPKNN